VGMFTSLSCSVTKSLTPVLAHPESDCLSDIRLTSQDKRVVPAAVSNGLKRASSGIASSCCTGTRPGDRLELDSKACLLPALVMIRVPFLAQTQDRHHHRDWP
jgi:hypothetical protein